MPAVIEATRDLAQRAVRPETPARLRLLVVLAMITAAALLISTSVLMSRVQTQVRTIGDRAAPQAATAADLYFALSDLDAQVARLVLVGNDDALAGTKIDALGTYRERGAQIDADLQQALAVDAGNGTALGLLDDLGVYRERVWQTLSTSGNDRQGYYTQATNVMHLELLPAARHLRDSSTAQLDQAYGAKSTTETAGVILTLLLGALLLLQLIVLQGWLTRRFRRVLNPSLILATILTIALAAPAILLFVAQGQRLGDARDQRLTPYLQLSEARAISYDAAADTSRYLISGNTVYQDDFTRKSQCLLKEDGCGDASLAGSARGSDVSPDAAAQVLKRWQAYENDHRQITQLADGGRMPDAVEMLTGIRRGDAAFDFSYYDDAVGKIAVERKAGFDQELHDTKVLLRGWTVVPIVAMGLVLLLIPFAVRRRFAEYR